MSAFSLALAILGWLLFALSACGVGFTVLSAVLMRRFFHQPPPPPARALDPVTILKPLYGDEPGLARNLAGVLAQAFPAPLQVVFGVQDNADPARAVAEGVVAHAPGTDATLRLDATIHGRNAKIANLINMIAAAKHPVLILSDSDIGVEPDYAARVAAALAAPGVGVVTCPYSGLGEGGLWSGLAAMGLSYQFLPNVIAGVSLGMAKPCMGSTIALHRETLERIGGFQAFRDILADDYAIGAAVRGLGLSSVVAPVLVSHSCSEESLAAVTAHELRWARTVKGVDAAGHAGSVITHPVPLAVLSALLLGFSGPALGLILGALAARVWLMGVTDGVIGRKLGPWWLLPARDMLSFYVFGASFFVRSVEWRGARFHVSADGDLTPAPKVH